ncbi:nuclear transport factor 2 family protein [Dactylosporangium aurantiacum]|uniref:Nuclear transport factor 2 family protein n=1 Tax=Dactylosporangium aurantiacum TaxID=35754 RepID=A0A9Q9MS22_9ACTN|nr:nuclear transport factor 2 family protein [Dactylosporangium aurantiacum]MDG6103715.1 nuclear transport factor 2 family protein [Dactylosporangium aurantiacum]UWZ59067.1 nuclear transport factor 2 family protein [Dactylosporangium aurantiacum]
MSISVDDRTTITDLIKLHGHLTDRGDFDGLTALFTEDVVYDVSALGGTPLAGLAGAREAALALGDGNPVAHHVTNIVLREIDDGVVHALSKGLGVRTDGSVDSVTYEDTVERTPAGWRITHRVVRPRRTPLRD